MLVGVCHIEMFVPDSNSLKAKRSVLNSLKKRIRNKFNVSVAEVGMHDKWQRTSVAISMVCNDRKFIDMTVNQILHLIEMDGRVEILNHAVELY